MPARHFLRCLGTPELRGPGGEPVRFRTRKHLALLVYLATEPRQPQRRDRLADLLWPDASPAEGRHSLATALSVLRGKLGPRTFETSRDAVRLVAPDLEVDLDRLARGEVLGDDVTPPLEMGGFLDDFDVTRAPEFMLWRELRRAHWFPAIRTAFIALMDRCRRTGDFARIEPLADRLLGLDELSEDAVRAKMEGRAFAGDRLSALRIFQGWRQKLAEELGATPSPLVEGMALRLRQRGYEPPGTSHIPTVPTDQWRDRAFVGRGSQYRIVYERWEQTARRCGRHALLLGDSGIGKTTLVERLVTAAGLEGAVSSRVQCYEVEREIPYAAIGTLVRGMLDRPGATATPPEWLAELARTMPAVAHRFANLPAARESEGETARLRLTEGVHQLATAVADEHPLILVVDDVHLADDASVAVLHLLMRRTQEQPIMIILTARQAELARSPHAGRLMEVRQALALEPVELPPLTDEEMGQVVTALAATTGLTLPPAVRRALLRAAAGNPMVAELLFDDWRVHQDQCLALSVGAMTVDARGEGSEEVFRQLLDRVFQGLSPAARAVLNLAAILGERLNDLTMYELVDLTLAQTLAGMSELTGLRILRDGGRELEFRNEMLRGHAYLSVPSPLRRALHGLIADRLLLAEEKGEAVPGLMLAWHCYRAGRQDAAAPYLLRGSREAIEHGAPFATELAISSAMPSLLGENLREGKLLLVEALQEQGRYRESLDLLHGIDSTATHELLRLALSLNARGAAIDSEPEARTLLPEVLELLDRDLTHPAVPPALVAVSRLLIYLDDPALSTHVLERAESLGRVRASIVSEVAGVLLLATAAWSARRLREYPALLEYTAELSNKCKGVGLESSVRFNLENIRGCLATTVGNYQLGADAYVSAHDVAVRIGDDERTALACANIALCKGRLGQYPEQARWAEKSLALVPKAHPNWRWMRPVFYLAWSLGMTGRTNEAIATIESQRAELSPRSPMWLAQAWGVLQADVYTIVGQPKKALATAERALRNTGDRPLTGAYLGPVTRWAVLTAVNSDREENVDRILGSAIQAIDNYDLVDQAEVLSVSAWIRRRRGQDCQEYSSALSERLSRLPAAVENQLSRLRIPI